MVNPTTSQAVLAATLGLVVLLAVIYLSRKDRLSFRYAIGWMAVASLGIFASPLVGFLEPISSELGFSPAGLFGLIAMIFLVAITIQLSISISGVQRQIRKLADEAARLRNQFENGKPGNGTAG